MRRRALTKNRCGRRATTQVSLFPFLAVLICTMGALILLLVVIARQAQLHAAQIAQVAEAETAEQEAQKEKEEREAREDVQWQTDQLTAAREATEAQVAEARMKLGHIEDHARRLGEQMVRLEAVLADLDKHGADERRQRGELEAELAKVKADVEEAEKQLDEARRVVGQRRRSFAVVPYEGRFQTRRRPIYIECTADAVTLQPEGIVLSPADFDGPLGPGNPLASALRATREYLLAKKEFDPHSVAGEPYPLLLVRPDGVTAYYAARMAMRSWGSEFGYELIDEDWKLQFRHADPELERVVTRAVEIARLRQRRLAVAAPRFYRSGSGVRYRAGRSYGIVPDGVLPPDEGRDARHFSSFNDRFGPPRSSQAGTNSGVGPYQAAGGQASKETAGQSPYTRARLGGTNHATNHGTAQGPSGYGTGETGGGSIGSKGDGVGGKGPGGPYAEGSNFGTAAPGATGPQGTGQSGSPTTADAGMRGGVRGGAASGAPGGNSGGKGGAGMGTSGSSGFALRLPGAKKSSAPDAATQGVSVNATQTEPQGKPRAGNPQTGEASSPDQWRRSPAEGNSAEVNRTFSHRPARSLARSRGRDWALRNTTGGIPISRPIRIECHADRLVVAPGRGGTGGKTIPMGPQTTSALPALVLDIGRRMETWGIAGDEMYWRPTLNVYVAPGAEQRFEDLNLLLENSGLNVQRKR